MVQNGITRNEKLYNAAHKLQNECTRFLLTVENEPSLTRNGLFAVPNYEIITFKIFHVRNKKVWRTDGCGGGYYTDHVDKMKIKDNSHLEMNCQKCYNNSVGCFIKLK